MRSIPFRWRAALFSLVVACSPQENPNASTPKFSAQTYEALLRGEAQDVIVLLQNPGTEANDPSSRTLIYREISSLVRESLPEESAEERYVFSHMPMLSLSLREISALESLDANPLVAQIFPNEAHEASLNQSLGLIGQPAAATAGHTGAGTTVAVLDTGADFTLPAFGSCTSAGDEGCKVIVAQDFAPPDNLRDDSSRHGTNVSGVVLGVAPGAQIAALDVFRSDGLAYSSDIIAALDWVIQHKETYNIASVNMSLGGGSATSACPNSIFAAAISNVKDAGVVTVVASGNDGFTNAISSPACAPDAVSVGAVYDTSVGSVSWSSCNDATTAADRVTCFSNSAPFLSLLAPGALINAAGITMGGTSQAAPHVAGAMAVVKAAFPEKNPDQLLALLKESGVSVMDHRNGLTFKRIDLAAAVSDCVTSVSPTSLSISAEGGEGSVFVAADGSCPWTVTSHSDFVTILSGDSGIGSRQVTFTVDANASTPRTGALTVARRTVTISQDAEIDTAGPIGTVSINNNAEFANNPVVTLSLAANDPDGVAAVCINDVNNCSLFGPLKPLALPNSSGLHSVNVWFKDELGNLSAQPTSDTILLDVTKPSDGIFTATPGASQVILSWSGFADEHSGIDKYKIVFASSLSVPGACASETPLFVGKSSSFTHSGLANGVTYSYRICAIDFAGNVSFGATRSARPATEFVPPVGSITINNGATFATSPLVTVNLSATDTSGVAGVCLSSGATCASFLAYSTSKLFLLPAGTGTKSVNAWFKDGQGNVSLAPVTDTITLDTTRPIDGTLSSTKTPGKIALFWTVASDIGSGLNGYKLVFTTGATPLSSCNTGTALYMGPSRNFTHAGLTKGVKYNYRLCALDNAGNISIGKATSITAP